MINRLTSGILLLLFICLSTFSVAQTVTNDALESFVNETKAVISIDNATESVNFIRFPRAERLELPGADLESKVQAFLDQYGEIFGIQNPAEELPFFKTEIDQFGFSHVYFKQLYQQVAVFGGDLRFHFDDESRLSAVNGVFIPDLGTVTFPLLSDDVLIAIAKAHVESTIQVNPTQPLDAMDTELFIFRDGLVKGVEGNDHLVLEVTLSNYSNVLEYVYVDAIKGTIVERFTGTHAVLNREVYESDFGNLVWQEGDAFPGSLTIWQQNEVEAAGHTYHFFSHAFNYESFDGASAVMRTINNNPNLSCPNASWNGSTTNYCDGTASDDVIGHEWAHAYTSYTSQLIYAWQAGALNESYSDIWGEVIDLLNNYEDGDENLSLRTSCNSSDRWMIGEDATAFGNPIRDMWDPTCKNDPGKVSDSEYKCGEGDNGGVHTNSGVNNHAFALLVDGGNYNGESISALGLTKTSHIFWRAQKYYLTSTSDFAVQADALEMSCSDLVGINLEGLSTGAIPAGLSGQMITISDCNEVSEVIDAVEFRDDPPCNFAPLLASNPPDICPPEEYRHDVLVQDFESGLGNWNVAQIPQNPATWEDHDWEVIDTLPDNRPGSGVYGADLIIGNCSSDLENGIIRLISPWMTIPAAASDPVKLIFDHYVSLENKWDGGNIKYKLNNGSWTVIPASAFIFNP
ncbi:MAG: M4 family peptidase, partial [Bacteroidetes bacterium]